MDLVFSAARRIVANPAQAEEIAQVVFPVLARKAPRLRRGVLIGDWLHEATRLAAISFLRAERRRQNREQEAYMQSTLESCI
ncbi:MAG TPA: sigma factor [Candidatus Acidoferrales bacterium]|nr:sigma factor [Candidatus Acidoferrales bacterium]